MALERGSAFRRAGDPDMKIHVRYFASLREALGPAESIDIPHGATVADARALLRTRSARHAEVLAPGRAVRAALDQAMVQEASPLCEGAELAFFPPVTGG